MSLDRAFAFFAWLDEVPDPGSVDPLALILIAIVAVFLVTVALLALLLWLDSKRKPAPKDPWGDYGC